jgi:hypothetical protein
VDRPVSRAQDLSGRSGDWRGLAHAGVRPLVTGVTWVDGALWHGTWEGDESELRRVDPQDGEVLERLKMPAGTGVSGLEADDGERFTAVAGSGRLRAVRRPK